MNHKSENQQLVARIDLFDEAIFLTQYNSHGPKQCREIATFDLAAALSGVKYKSPLLPLNCLSWSMTNGEDRYVIFIPPEERTVTALFTAARIERITFPFPPLVWIGGANQYHILAIKERPTKLHARLFRAPFPNVDHDGRVCWGTAEPPIASHDTMHTAFQTFVESDFNGHLANGSSTKHNGDVRKTWLDLAGLDEYPLDDLVFSRYSLREVI